MKCIVENTPFYCLQVYTLSVIIENTLFYNIKFTCKQRRALNILKMVPKQQQNVFTTFHEY